MGRHLLVLVGILLTAVSTLAQDYKQFQSMYKNALQLYMQKDTLKAIEELEKIIKLKPNFTDAIYDLGVIHYQAGNREKAINLFQTAVRQGDRKAAEILKEELQQKIAYTDTMLIDDVDVKPYVLVNSKKTGDKSWTRFKQKYTKTFIISS